MKRILILFAHPALEKSRINTHLQEAWAGLDGVTVHDLYEAYPEFDIDVAQEQALLEQHDVVVFHHPLFWYSTPALLKEWQDLVLEHGWAYGSQGNALRGKLFFNVITAGGREEAYTPEGYNGRTLRQLLAPIEQTTKLCKMAFLPPFVIYGTHAIAPPQVAAQQAQLRALLQALRDEQFAVAQAEGLVALNDFHTLVA